MNWFFEEDFIYFAWLEFHEQDKTAEEITCFYCTWLASALCYLETKSLDKIQNKHQCPFSMAHYNIDNHCEMYEFDKRGLLQRSGI